MSKAGGLLQKLRDLGIKIWLEGDRLRFRAPKGALTPGLRAQLKQNRDEISRLLAGARQAVHSRRGAIESAPRDGSPLPLSFAQLRLWFVDRMDEGSPAYNMAAALRLEGRLVPAALQRSLLHIVERHESLRTSFPDLEGRPYQLVAPAPKGPFPLADLSHLARGRREAELQRLAREEAVTPFDVRTGPVLRVLLVRLGPSSHALLATMHHIVSDGWSLQVFSRELTQHYAAFARGEASPAQALSLQYADYASWQRRWLSEGLIDSQFAYWRKQLADAPEMIRLPADRPRPPRQGYRGANLPIRFGTQLTTRLRALNKGTGTTLFMAILAGYSTLLSRLSGQKDVLVGTPIANRTQPQVEPLIGFFANTLVLRVDLDGNPSLADLLERVRKVSLDAHANQDVPFEQLVEQLRPARSLDHPPLFQTSLLVQNMREESLRLPDLRIDPLPVQNVLSKFDLTLVLQESEGSLAGWFEYSRDLFEAETVARWGRNLLTLLHRACIEPAASLASLSMLDSDERRCLLDRWGVNPRQYPAVQAVHHLAQKQAARTPEAVAVRFGGADAHTFGQLEARSNRLAHRLLSMGVGPETRVALCLERCAELAPVVLAVLKAGGAYLPIEPSYPSERIAYMLADSQAGLLVTGEWNRLGVLPTQAPRIGLRDLFKGLEDWPSHPPAVPVHGDNAAYVIYTSGTTGRPKGATISHRALCNHVLWFQEEFQLTDQDAFLLRTPFSFDPWATEFFATLTSGARLVLALPQRHGDPAYLARLIEAEKATLVQMVPSLLRAMLEEPQFSHCASLRVLFSGGEALPPDLIESFGQRLRSDLVNLYGPTEACIDATHWRCPAALRSNRVPIGRPAANLQALVLDQAGEPTPIGVAGELHLGGLGLGRGYEERAALTACRFIPSRFASSPGQRLYRTGDRARFLADGSIEFLGRLDGQIKLRGFRIELEEIESALAQHRAVKEAAAAVREERAGEKRIAAYWVPDSSAEGLGDWLRRQEEMHLSQQRELYKSVYGESQGQGWEPDFDLAGWTSSYTGLAIPEEEMREWVAGAVDRIRELKPDRVLEIGCGTGLLASRLAPECSSYWACDFSQEALTSLKRLREQDRSLSSLQISHRFAHDFTGVEAGSFDTVILNSVVQYFPSVDYLLQVLDGAVEALRPGGAVFLGDIRNLNLLKAFHASVQLEKAQPWLDCRRLRERIEHRASSEEELLIDPEFFSALATRHPRISGFVIELKPGRFSNEMTKFRYDAVLTVEGKPPCLQSPPVWEWPKGRWDLAGLRDRLSQERPSFLQLRAVPNGRIGSDMEALEFLAQDRDGAGRTVQALRRELKRSLPSAIDPEELRELCTQFGYRARFNWSQTGGPGCFDAVLSSHDSGLHVQSASAGEVLKPWHRFASNPLRSVFRSQLEADLRRYLESKLPEYMQPSSLTMTDGLPRSPSGKVDRGALPAPDPFMLQDLDSRRSDLPRTPIQEMLSIIWCSVLGRDEVGVRDDFFEMGGHSLLATQVVSRIRQALAAEIPVRALFEAPTIADLAPLVESARRQGSQHPAPPLGAVPREDDLPLSFAQQRLWFLDRFEGPSSTYNMSAALRLTGRLDLGALAESLKELILRHEVLRTRFPMRNGQPAQVIDEEAAVALPLVDLSRLAPTVRDAEAGRLAAQETERPFHLAQGGLLRTTLIRLTPASEGPAPILKAKSDGRPGAEEPSGRGSWLLLSSMHHIISDGWSMGIFASELSSLYSSLSQGGPPSLPALPVQYADFALWQRRWLDEDELERQTRFWREQLEDAPRLLELPCDRPRPPMQTFRGGIEDFGIEADTSQRLAHWSRQSGHTLFMTLLAAYAVLLARWSGSRDFVIGTPIANRSRAEIEGLIGFFVNTLALRTDLRGDPAFEAFADRIRRISLEAYAHQDVPFEKLVEELQPERSLSHTPLFQVFFALQNLPSSSVELSQLSVAPWEMEGVTAKFDLSLYMDHRDGRLLGWFEYNSDLFEAASIRRLSQRFKVVLEGIADNPAGRLSQLPALSRSERRQLMAEWNDTAQSPPPCPSLHGWFEAQAAKRPQATAIRFQGRFTTYGELESSAHNVANRLLSRGARRGEPTAVLLERSPELVAALLGVLKIGGAYVPLDPEYPPERLSMVLQDCGARLLVTSRELYRGLDGAPAQPVFLDEAAGSEGWELGRQPTEGQEIAYLIYTSGSTGRPKGVQVPHRAVVNFLDSMRRRPGLQASDRLLAVTTVSFDIHVLELFLPLIVGGEVILASREEARDGRALMRLLHDSGATAMQATPATWRLLIASGWEGNSNLKILCGGESLAGDLCQQLTRRGASLWNLYGPTETTVWSTLSEIVAKPHDRPAEAVESIGRPIANTRVFILDESMRLVPIGASGELHIGGSGLALGYRGRSGLTAQKFVPDPFSPLAGARLYKTGDRARYRSDGSISFQGRFDHQVKIRGHRIELGEVEAALSRHPAIRAAIAAVDLSRGDQSLAAYAEPDYELLEGDVRDQGPGQERISRWQSVWSAAYQQPSFESDPLLNSAGWNDSYSGQPIPAQEMLEWVETTAERILSRRPRRVLEIGCGTGMLLLRLAPHCESYAATDISSQALTYVESQLQSQGNAVPVDLWRRAADDFDEVAAESCDAVVLNSVVQYFPDASYLKRVLTSAVEATASGGTIFVGDVRNLALLEAFHFSLQLHAANSAQSLAQLRRNARMGLEEEEELVLDPGFFVSLASRLPRVRRVEIQLRRGSWLNEMTRFRYDVTLHVGREETAPTPLRWVSWRPDMRASDLSSLLERDAPDLLAVRGIPNRRLAQAAFCSDFLEQAEPDATAGLLQRCWQSSASELEAVDPEEIWSIEDTLPYQAFVFDSVDDRLGRFDVVLQKLRRRDQRGEAPRFHYGEPPGDRSRLCNHPLRKALARRLAPELRDFLKSSLPDYMLPASLILLESLPLTPNGKVDRLALPQPGAAKSLKSAAYVEPRDIWEMRLAQIYEDVLEMRPIGAKDGFFTLGGHSLLAVKLMDRIAKAFGREIPLTALFESETVEQLARLLHSESGEDDWSPLVPIQPQGDLPPLFCVHPAGGTVLCYFDLARELGPNQPVYGLQALGLEEGQTPFGSVEEMARFYIEAIEQVHPEGPCLLCGWSLGGLIAYEMGRQLEAKKREVGLVALLDAFAVSFYPIDSLPRFDEDATLYAHVFGKDLDFSADQIRPLTEAEQIEFLLKRLKDREMMPAEADLARAMRLLRLFKRNMRLDYRPGESSVPVAVFHVSRHEGVETERLLEGWRELVRGPFHSVEVAGEHETFVSPPHVESLASELKACLDRFPLPSGADPGPIDESRFLAHR